MVRINQYPSDTKRNPAKQVQEEVEEEVEEEEIEEEDEEEEEEAPRRNPIKKKVSPQQNNLQLVTENGLINAKLDYIIKILERE